MILFVLEGDRVVEYVNGKLVQPNVGYFKIDVAARSLRLALNRLRARNYEAQGDGGGFKDQFHGHK